MVIFYERLKGHNIKKASFNSRILYQVWPSLRSGRSPLRGSLAPYGRAPCRAADGGDARPTLSPLTR